MRLAGPITLGGEPSGLGHSPHLHPLWRDFEVSGRHGSPHEVSTQATRMGQSKDKKARRPIAQFQAPLLQDVWKRECKTRRPRSSQTECRKVFKHCCHLRWHKVEGKDFGSRPVPDFQSYLQGSQDRRCQHTKAASFKSCSCSNWNQAFNRKAIYGGISLACTTMPAEANGAPSVSSPDGKVAPMVLLKEERRCLRLLATI